MNYGNMWNGTAKLKAEPQFYLTLSLQDVYKIQCPN